MSHEAQAVPQSHPLYPTASTELHIKNPTNSHTLGKPPLNMRTLIRLACSTRSYYIHASLTRIMTFGSLPSFSSSQATIIDMAGLDAKQLGCSVEEDSAKPSFLSLPGELRNKVYALALISQSPIYVQCFRGEHPPQANALLNLSLLNRQIRMEARSFFFANNRFRAWAPLSPVRFLTNIGSVERAFLTSLNCCGYYSDVHLARQFYTYLGQCTNLRELCLIMDMEYICIDNPATLRAFLRNKSRMTTSSAIPF
jgi:hypothetical protein